MTTYTVYIANNAGSASGGDGTSGLPYGTMDEMNSNIVADTGLADKDLSTSQDAVIVVFQDMVLHTSRILFSGWTTDQPGSPGDPGTLSFVADTGKEAIPALINGTAAAGILGDAALGIELWAPNDGNMSFLWQHCRIHQQEDTVNDDAIRHVTAPPYATYRYCDIFGNQLTPIGAVNQTLVQGCILGRQDESVNGRNSWNGDNVKLVHCTSFMRPMGANMTIESCLECVDYDNPFQSSPSTETLDVLRTAAFYQHSDNAGDPDYVLDLDTGSIFNQDMFTDGWFNDHANYDYSISSAGETAAGTVGGGTNDDTDILSEDAFGTAIGTDSSMPGAIQPTAGGGGSPISVAANYYYRSLLAGGL